MKILASYFFIVGLLTISVNFQARAQGDNFFQNTSTELYTYGSLRNKEIGADESDVTQEITNSVITTNNVINNDILLANASTSARASYGYLLLGGNANYATGFHIPPVFDYFYGETLHSSGSGWRDHVAISNASLNGTAGYLRISLIVSGNLSAAVNSDDSSGGSAEPSWSIQIGNNNQSLMTASSLEVIPPPNQSQAQSTTINLNASALAASNGVANVDIPFTFGQQFYLFCHLSLANTFGIGPVSLVSSGSQQGNVQVLWQGATVLDANSNMVSNFNLTSDSGTDWTVPQSIVAGILKVSVINILGGTNLVINGTGGTFSNQVYLLTSTNLAWPMTNWVYLNTNIFDNVGHASFTNGIIPSEPQRYFRLLSQ